MWGGRTRPRTSSCSAPRSSSREATTMLHAFLALFLASPAPTTRPRPEILVFAAASLSDALTEIGHAYEVGGGGKVSFNFAASNDLARQIEAGAPAAIFVSANKAQAERLEK